MLLCSAFNWQLGMHIFLNVDRVYIDLSRHLRVPTSVAKFTSYIKFVDLYLIYFNSNAARHEVHAFFMFCSIGVLFTNMLCSIRARLLFMLHMKLPCLLELEGYLKFQFLKEEKNSWN